MDHLQSALQPLGDNLEFATYEVVSRTIEASERLTEERSDDGRSINPIDRENRLSDDGGSIDGPTNLPSSLSTDIGA